MNKPATTPSKKLLIGGQALRVLGSARHTDDVDYMASLPNSKEMFVKEDGGEIVNAAAHQFFAQVWAGEADNDGDVASPQALVELKAFAFVQHCLNMAFQKADDAEYDIKYLVRKFGVVPELVYQHIGSGPAMELRKVVQSVKM